VSGEKKYNNNNKIREIPRKFRYNFGRVLFFYAAYIFSVDYDELRASYIIYTMQKQKNQKKQNSREHARADRSNRFFILV